MDQVAKLISKAALCALLASPVAAQTDMIAQRHVVGAFKDLVLSISVARRIGDVCPAYELDTAKARHFERVFAVKAVETFPTLKSWEETVAEIYNDPGFAADLERYFVERGMAWGAGAEAYCALGESVKSVGLGLVPVMLSESG